MQRDIVEVKMKRHNNTSYFFTEIQAVRTTEMRLFPSNASQKMKLLHLLSLSSERNSMYYTEILNGLLYFPLL